MNELSFSNLKTSSDKLRDLKESLRTLNKNIKETLDLIKDADAQLSKEHPKLNADLKEFQMEAQILTIEAVKEKKIPPEEPIKDPFKDGEDFKSDDEMSALCKDVFREISKSCHPDKTDDKALHPLFSEACEALTINDYMGLKDLQDQIGNPLKSLNVAKELIALKKIWDSKLERYTILKASPGFSIAKGYFSKDLGENIQSNQEYTHFVYELLKQLNLKCLVLKKRLEE